MATLEPKTKKPSLIAFVLGLLAAISLFIFFSYPQLKDWENNRTEVVNAQNQSNALSDKISEAQDSITKLTSGSGTAYSDMLNQALPDQASIPDIYAYLEYLVNSSNLVLGSLQATDESAKPKSGQSSPFGTASAPAAGNESGSAQGAKAKNPLPETVGVVQITMDVKGDLEGLNHFLHNLGSSRLIMDVQSIEVTTNAENKVTDYKLVINTYYEKGGSSTGGANAKE